jgi:hypothetical protein
MDMRKRPEKNDALKLIWLTALTASGPHKPPASVFTGKRLTDKA